MTLSLLLAMKRFSRRSYKEEIVSTVWRHFSAVPITGLLLASTATIAMADTVNPPEGGVWRYGRGYSDYFHGSKKHGSSVNMAVQFKGSTLCARHASRPAVGPMLAPMQHGSGTRLGIAPADNPITGGTPYGGTCRLIPLHGPIRRKPPQ